MCEPLGRHRRHTNRIGRHAWHKLALRRPPTTRRATTPLIRRGGRCRLGWSGDRHGLCVCAGALRYKRLQESMCKNGPLCMQINSSTPCNACPCRGAFVCAHTIHTFTHTCVHKVRCVYTHVYVYVCIDAYGYTHRPFVSAFACFIICVCLHMLSLCRLASMRMCGAVLSRVARPRLVSVCLCLCLCLCA